MVAVVICLVVIYLHLLSHEMTQKIYREQTEKTITDLKKDFIKDTVNNVFLEIDRLRQTKYISYGKNLKSRQKRIEGAFELTDEAFIRFVKEIFKGDTNDKMWTALMWDSESGRILYATPNLKFETMEITIPKLQKDLSSYAELEKNNIKVIFGVSLEYIEGLVKEEIANVIKSRKFSSDSYIWINEIKNYEGGKNYAIRRVQPNLKGTEGDFISTDMQDVNGKYPYLEELEGIKKDGELFFTYHFKELNSFHVSEKLSYAKLYKDYDWIIAMGLHLNEIDDFTKETNEEIASLATETTLRLLKYILFVLLFGFIALYVIERSVFSTSTRSLQKEVNLDTLTKAYSRRFGEKTLASYFMEYKLAGHNAAIMMFDLDGFKYINDYYGHKVGDLVLIEVVAKINSMIRSSDYLLRWGGDEFVGIFPGLRGDIMSTYGEKILNELSTIQIPVGDEVVTVTVSIGFSDFKEGDVDYNDVLKRADDAMYYSKEHGKNRVTVDSCEL